jgi:hypothetical protein
MKRSLAGLTLGMVAFIVLGACAPTAPPAAPTVGAAATALATAAKPAAATAVAAASPIATQAAAAAAPAVATAVAGASPAIATAAAGASPAAATAVAGASPAVATAAAGASPVAAAAAAAAAASPIRITDARVDPSDAAISLQNTSGTAVDLTGWRLRIGSASAALPSAARVGPNESLTVHTAAGTNTARDIYLGPEAAALLQVLQAGATVELVDQQGNAAASFRLPG